MTRARSTLALVFLSVAALCFTSTTARAQGEAQCAWLKIKAVGRGTELLGAPADPNAPTVLADLTGLGKKRSVKALCYAQLVYAGPSAEFPSGRYTAPLLCLRGANDDWQMTDADNGMAIDLLPDGSGFTDDDYLTFHDASGDVVQGYASHVLTLKLDKEGAFKKAIWRTLGAQMMDGSTFFREPSRVFGGYVAKGTTVPAEKVPDGARALVSGGVCP